MKQQVIQELKESANVKLQLAEESAETVVTISDMLADALSEGHTVLFCGNGGSAADAQHLAAELLGKFKMERKALPAIALTVNTSALTAIANDYSYDNVFERLVEAYGRKGDVLLGISTSGNSKNVAKAIVKAREMGIQTVAFCGLTPGAIGEKADICLTVPSKDTPRIQEAHITAGHIICGLIERKLFGDLRQ
ncbi:MAG: D-sedoheptulose 7-phosphate isomerase [Armatimonadota bacterium]